MAIKTLAAPAQSIAVLTNQVQQWTLSPVSAPHAANAGISFAAEEVDVRLPHPMYNVTLQDLAAGRGLSQAAVVSWRYLLSDGEAVALAAVTQSTNADTHTFAMLNRGPFVSSLVDTVDAAEKNATLQKGDYTIAVLHVPALYVMALWLRASQPGGGVLIPLAPAPSFLTAGTTYTETAFVQAMLPTAEQALQSGGPALA